MELRLLYITGEDFLKVNFIFNKIIQKFKYNKNNNIEVDAFTLKAEKLLKYLK